MRAISKLRSSIRCDIDKTIFDKLTYYSRLSGLTKTAIVERALEEYLNRQMPNELRNNYLYHK